MNSLFEKLDLILNDYSKIVLMSHIKPDLDAFGSSLGIYEILKRNDKEVAIFLDINEELHSSVKEALEIVSDINYINSSNYTSFVDRNTLILILDVHQKERIYYKEILDSCSNIVVIDHHIKNRDYIKNTLLFYIDSYSSSMAEMITYYSKYKKIKFTAPTSTIMLAGIEVDTNNYNLKTTEDTYYAAGILVSYGADNILKQELLKEKKAEYLKRADYIKSSFILKPGIAVCIINDSSTNEELSVIAEEMLKFEDMEATFAIGKLESNTIGISAKSIGNIDVCKLMKKFDGGGHSNNAAAQIKNSKMQEVLNNLTKILEV